MRVSREDWWRANGAEWKRYPWGALAGLLLGASFPEPGIAGLAWLVPGILWLATVGLPAGAAFRVGWMAGMVTFLVSLRWLLHIPFPAGAAAGWLALSAYCGLFMGLWTLWLQGRHGVGPSGETPPGDLSWRGVTARWTTFPWRQRAGLALWGASAWVVLEWVRGVFLTGFPWNFLGVSQWRQLPLVQWASVTGVLGVSFIVAWVSLALAGSTLAMMHRPSGRRSWLADVRVPLLVVCGIIAWGMHRVMTLRPSPDADGEVLRLVLIQPSIPQTLMWDPESSETSFQAAMDLTLQALALGPDVVVWPEGSFGLTVENAERMRRVVVESGVSWIFGADGVDPVADTGPGGREPDGPARFHVYNSAYWMDEGGRLRARYDKCRLVIFGEYIPLERWFPFMRWLTPIGSSFSSGDGPVPFPVGDPPWELSPVICFEDIFPAWTRGHVGPETEALLELTNDGWFGRSSAQWQHAANSMWRSVENGVPLIRATNNGLTAWFDATGALRDVLGGNQNVYGPGFLWVRLERRPGTLREPTVYRRLGDRWVMGLAVLLGWDGVRNRLRHRVRRGGGTPLCSAPYV